MRIDRLLRKLDAVKQTGEGRWVARCPTHEDKHASLSIRELEDGRILVHDFAGCGVAEILAAVHLKFEDLYPERPPAEQSLPGERRPFPAAAVLRTLCAEITVIVIYAGDIRAGRTPSHADHERFLIACRKIGEGASYAVR